MSATRASARSALERRFIALHDEFGPAIARLAHGYEADASKRAELVQEIFLNVWRALPGFEGRSSERTYLYRIAHNVAITHVKNEVRAAPEPDTPSERSAEEQLSKLEQLRRLRAAIRTLPPADRQILLLYLEGFSAAETADVVGVTVSVVTTRIGRAKQRLRRLLGGET